MASEHSDDLLKRSNELTAWINDIAPLIFTTSSIDHAAKFYITVSRRIASIPAVQKTESSLEIRTITEYVASLFKVYHGILPAEAGGKRRVQVLGPTWGTSADEAVGGVLRQVEEILWDVHFERYREADLG